jgi:hypothetical protein
MSANTFVQFDLDVADAAQLLNDLTAAAIPALSVSRSRWVRRDPLTLGEFDAGPRLDIEIAYRARLESRAIVEQLQVFIASYAGTG